MNRKEFKVIPIRGKFPIVVDYCNYKITFFMDWMKGMTVKFFRFHEDRWYKIKETSFEYFQIDECILWAKNSIDSDETGYFDSLLRKQIEIKRKGRLTTNPQSP